MLKTAVQLGRSERRRRTASVEPLREARTTLTACFSILLRQPGPLREGRSLPDSLSLGIHDIPDESILDKKAASC